MGNLRNALILSIRNYFQTIERRGKIQNVRETWEDPEVYGKTNFKIS
jgi:hypothetical protein